MYLLDTNAVIAAMKGHQGMITRIRAQRPQDVFVSAVVLHELYYGAFRSERTEANIERVDALQFQTLDFDADDARKAGEVRARLAASGAPIGPYDVHIAGQALSRDLILVTRNLREFKRLAGLRVEDWENGHG
jgi:tRNA(fMet)-specific endonuclease VapC